MISKREGFVETLVGGIVLLLALGFIVYSVKTTNLNKELSNSNFVLYANFTSVQGVNLGSEVLLAGVKVGTVTNIELDKESFQAKTTLSLFEDYKLPEDTEAVISTEGLLGGNYISLNVGGSDIVLNHGEELLYTQSSTSILNLLSKFTSQ
ncbi:MAG: outer membrane lipid asymmetry maintenance protein MlaD [Paracoccaceae bacterium]|nr:outer membrane lipid asymmetry maintenance protein MlaD [Paracoccaceae bacterium]